MEVENHHHHQSEKWEEYVDWRGRPAHRGRHGGFLAASFVLVVEVMENMAFLANASNLVLYMLDYMHFTPSKASNTVTNFMGTAFFLALLGGFLSDAFFTTYQVYLTSAAVEFLGLVILTVQAYIPSLQPPRCATPPCQEPKGSEAAMLYLGLYLAAAGVGGIKGSLPTHGAEQFEENTPQGRINRSTFFNYFVFCLSAGGLIATTLVVWVEDNVGWKWGFFISTVVILLSIPVFLAGSGFYRSKVPTGSPLTTISKVLLGAILNSCMSKNTNNAVANLAASPLNYSPAKDDSATIKNNNQQVASPDCTDDDSLEIQTDSLKFLNRAVNSKPACQALECTIKQVEEVKVVLKILPIFASTIILNCCLAQLSTFSVQQAASMDTTLGSLKIPPASLPVFPIVIIMVIAPLYDHLIIPFFRRVTKRETGISHLQRIGTGLVLSIVAMAVAALVEVKRKHVARDLDMIDAKAPLPLTFFWIAIQYALLGSADLFTLAGMLEFFFTEAPSRMRSLATSLSWASLAIGYYLSSVIVSIVNGATGRGEHKAWLAGGNLNRYHLERFYWLLCVLGVLNFLNYLFWACRYKYRSTGSKK